MISDDELREECIRDVESMREEEESRRREGVTKGELRRMVEDGELLEGDDGFLMLNDENEKVKEFREMEEERREKSNKKNKATQTANCSKKQVRS